jgi:hypothetical protein
MKTMNDNPSNNLPDDATPRDEELVAYLDGELDAENARRIEALLASDPEVRRRLHSFERTWDLLDELDTAPVGEPFTRTTLEMVAIAARQDVEEDQADAPRRRRRWLLSVGASLLAAAVVGFCAVAIYDPDRQLLRDLPLLEDFDEYSQVGSIDFLRKLRDAKLFSKENADFAKGESANGQDIPSRRRRVASMSLDEKEQLLRSEDRFRGLTLENQQLVRRLYEDLRNDHDSQRLRAIMHDYYEWLKPLSPLSADELAKMPSDKRIDFIKNRIRQEQLREGGRRPDRKDMEALWKWMGNHAVQHEKTLLASMPESQRKQFHDSSKPWQHRMLFGQMLQRWQAANAGELPPMMTEKDLAELLTKLSPETRKRLEGKPPVEQWKLVAGWMRQGPRRSDEDRRMHGPLPKEEDERLAEFFEKNLSAEERDRLLAMPGEEMQLRLQKMYIDSARPKPPPGPDQRSDGPRRGRRPGDSDFQMPWQPDGKPPTPPAK